MSGKLKSIVIIREYLKEYIVQILSILFLAVFFVFVIFPYIMNLEIIKRILLVNDIKILFGFTSLTIIFCILSWSKANNLWRRYRNNYKLNRPIFNYLDGISLFLFFSLSLIFIFQKKSVPLISREFIYVSYINICIFIIWFFLSFYKKVNKKGIEKYESSGNYVCFNDDPIKEFHQDVLKRTELVETLYKEIINLPFKNSFVFGIYGEWGEGKTSLLNLLRKKIEENDNFIVVNFLPWSYKDENAILSAFYEQLELAISQNFVFINLKKALMKYQKFILTGISKSGLNLYFSKLDESLEKTKHRIETFINRLGKKIVIFIDDIDRLQPDEIVLMFKIIRQNLNFQNTIFVLSFDFSVITKCLKEHFNLEEEFLDKIIQKSINLPAIEQEDIDRFLGENLERIFKKIGITENKIRIFRSDISFIYQIHIRKLFGTLRRAKRFLNSFTSNVKLIKEEVNLCDFFILEVIRVFFQEIYLDILKYPWFYIPMNWSNEYESLLNYFYVQEEEERYRQIREHIEKLIDNKVRKEYEREVLRELLKKIFFVEVKNALDQTKMDYDPEDLRAEKRITHPECFKKYFMLRVPSTQIPDKLVETAFQTWNALSQKEREEKIERDFLVLQEKDQLYEFLDKVIIFKKLVNYEVAYSLIRSIYKFSNRFSKSKRNFLVNSEFSKAFILLLKLLNERVEKDQIESIIEEVIENCTSFHFAVWLTEFCSEGKEVEYTDIFKSTDIEKVRWKMHDRLKKYFVDNKRDIFEELESSDWSYILRQWASGWLTYDKEIQDFVNSYIFGLLDNDPKKFAVFLMGYASKKDSGEWVFENEIRNVFDVEKMKELSTKFKNHKSLSKEEKSCIISFLDQFKGNNAVKKK